MIFWRRQEKSSLHSVFLTSILKKDCGFKAALNGSRSHKVLHATALRVCVDPLTRLCVVFVFRKQTHTPTTHKRVIPTHTPDTNHFAPYTKGRVPMFCFFVFFLAEMLMLGFFPRQMERLHNEEKADSQRRSKPQPSSSPGARRDWFSNR